MEQFAERLAYAMARKQISQADLSRLSGIGKGSISNYLSGRWAPKGNNIYKLAQVLDVSPLWLDGHTDHIGGVQTPASSAPLLFIAQQDLQKEIGVMASHLSRQEILDLIAVDRAYVAADDKTKRMVRMLLDLEEDHG